MVARIRETLSDAGKGLSGARVLVVGVAYKPDVEDLRESPALEIMSGARSRRVPGGLLRPPLPAVALPDGTSLIGVDDPAEFEPDLVLMHTAHTSLDRCPGSRINRSCWTRHTVMADIPSRVLL